MAGLRATVHELYEGESRAACRFRYALLGLDVLAVFYLIASSFCYGSALQNGADMVLGAYVALDYAARFLIAPRKFNFLIKPLNIMDVLVIASALAALLGVNMAFLRALRILRLLRSYRLLNRLRADIPYFRAHEDIILSVVNLLMFIFLMTEAVFVTQVGNNPSVNHFLDAMYFTVTALTTTGFGDVILTGEVGRGLTIAIMIFGVSLFLRLMQTIFRPAKVRFPCGQCGLFLHDADAVHCKHCGTVLNIPTTGLV